MRLVFPLRLPVALLVVASCTVGTACELTGTDEVRGHGGLLGSGPGAAVGDGSTDDTAVGDGAASSLCGRVGGAATATAVADDTFTRLAMDCRIGVYFLRLSPTAREHFVACFDRYLNDLFGCGAVYAQSTDDDGGACRSMLEAHRNMGASRDDHKAFLESLAASLGETGHLAPADVEYVVSRAGAEKGTCNATTTGYPRCACAAKTECSAFGKDAGSGDSAADASAVTPRDAGRG